MNTVSSFVQRQPVALFCTLTVLLSFASYLLPVRHAALPFLIVLIPAFVALGLTAVSKGWAGVRALLAQLGQWRISRKWLAIALGLALVMRLAMSGVALLFGLIPAMQVRQASVGQLVILAVILVSAAIPEELGWRGYALPKLLTNHSACIASLVIGVAWGSLHLALQLPGMMNEGASPLATVLAIASGSVLFTWLYVHSAGNVVLTTLFHAAQSFFVIVNEGIPLEQQAWLMAGVYLALALIVVLLTGPHFTGKWALWMAPLRAGAD